jgi:PAS domain S-box-containing protein
MGKNKMETGEKESNPVNSGEKLAKVAQLFHLLEPDPQKNIDLLLEQTRSIIAGLFSVYLRGDNKQGTPVIRAGANLPRGFARTLSPQGHLFQDPLFAESLFIDPLFTNHGKPPGTYCILPRTTVMSDPLGKKLGLNACLGTPVFYKKKGLGTLWLADTQVRSFSPVDIHCIQVLAGALALEEERLAQGNLLLAKKNRFKGFYDATFEAIFLSKKGICIDQNKTAFHMFGYSMEEAIGKPGTDWILPRDHVKVEKNMLSGGTSPYEVTALRKDGSTFPAQIQATMINYEGEQLRVTALRDISELKKVQKSLVEEKERYKVLIDNVNDAIYIAQDGYIKFANPRTIAISGHTPEDLPNIPFLELVHPDDRENIQHNHQKRLKGEKVPSPYAFRIVNKQQVTLWVQLSAVRIIWEGKPAVLGCIRDISRIRELEEKLKQSEKMELIGTMAGGVAHDLNNILSGLVSYPELLLMQLDKDSPLVEPISFIHDTGIKAAEIVQDLLTLTRRGIHHTSVLNLNQVIHDYYNSSAHHRLERNFPEIHFKIRLEPHLLNLKGAESPISKIVMNLVMNAAEAVQTSGQVTIETFNRYVEINKGHQIPEGEYVVLRVSDTGEGISQADIKQIFEPFYTKKKMGRSGSGLGLSVVWNAVKDLEGYIDVSSQREKGTTFELSFKATRENLESIADDFQVESFKGNAQTVLVVDDIKGQRKIAQSCLEMLGYTPFAVSSGEAAISFLKKHPMDLLVLDMKMEPGMDGLETYQEVLKLYPKQKAVIASGFSETKRVMAAKKLGVGQYIKKPYTLEKFAVAVKKELAGKN